MAENKNDESAKLGCGCLVVVGMIILLAIGITSCGDDGYDYDDSYYEDSDTENFDDAVDRLQKELDQERMYGDEISDLDNE